MIEPKFVIISKENEIEDGWRLVSPTSFSVDANPFFKAPSLSDVRKAITYADSIRLSLAEPVLSGSIIEELKWVHQYAPIEIVAKDQAIVSRYSPIGFKKQEIDPDLSTNILIIEGKSPRALLIEDGFSDLEFSSLEKLDLLEGVVEAFCVGKNCLKDPAFETILAKGIKTNWILAVSNYSLNDHRLAKAKGISLFIASECKDAIVLLTSNGNLLRIVDLAGGKRCLAPIEKLSAFSSGLYMPNHNEAAIPSNTIAGNAFYCEGDSIHKLDLKDVLEITNNVEIPVMDGFVSNTFDSSVSETHNRHSREAKRVDYRFLLIPPREDETCVESAIYKPIHALALKWEKAQTLDLMAVKNEFLAAYPQGGKLIQLLDQIKPFTARLKTVVSKCDYRRYYADIAAIIDALEKHQSTVIDGCGEAYSSISHENSGTRFFKFDSEIEGYKATIEEKTALINKGVDVLSNKRRIDILNQKINDLLRMKERFQQSSSATGEKSLQAFLTDCRKLLNGETLPSIASGSESIGKVLVTKEETKESKLNAFVWKYLPLMKAYFEACLAIAKDLASVRIPEHGRVVDKDGKPYLVIDTEEDFEKTKEIRRELGLGCLAKR